MFLVVSVLWLESVRTKNKTVRTKNETVRTNNKTVRTKNHAYKKPCVQKAKRCVQNARFETVRFVKTVRFPSPCGGWAQEVDHGGAGAHLLLVVTKFSAVVALQGVATTYHGALKV